MNELGEGWWSLEGVWPLSVSSQMLFSICETTTYKSRTQIRRGVGAGIAWAWPRKPEFLAWGRALAGAASQIPRRVPLAVLVGRLMGMWGRERNARSGMACGYRGQGQTGLRSALWNPLRDPIQKGRCWVSQRSSGQKLEAMDVNFSSFWYLAEQTGDYCSCIRCSSGHPHHEGWHYPPPFLQPLLRVLGDDQSHLEAYSWGPGHS